MVFLLKVCIAFILLGIVWQFLWMVDTIREGLIEFIRARKEKIKERIANEVNKRYSLVTKKKKK